jgi:hypothetical protein
LIRGVTIPDTPEATVIVEMDELACDPVWVTSEAVVSDSPEERVKVGVLVLVVILELVTNEVPTPETAELASVPGLVAIEGVVSDMLWEKSGIVLETVWLVSAVCVTHEAVVFGVVGERDRVGTAELASLPGWVTSEAVVSG